MKKGLLLFFICIIFLFSLHVNAYVVKAEEKTISIVGEYYEAKKTYDTVWGNEDTYLGLTNEYKTLGEMSISGALESAELVDDAVSFIVDGDTFDIHYPISQERLSVTNDKRWHVSKSDGYTISVFTSLNNDNESYVKELFIDEGDFDDLHTEPIYQGKDIQLINGCYYKIVVDYMLEKNVGKKYKVLDDYEYRTEEEQYLFYVENTDKEKSATSETKPRQNLGELINTGHDNGFSGDEVIDKDDPHYGWNMGHFFINGYSGKNVTSDGIPIFLKNVGDKVTLWFNLEQGMDTSNPEDSLPLISKEKLALSRDENGYDRAFGTVQTHLGYGALMIQYTDEDGVKHDPVIYNDFLYANTRTGADKRVVLLEEGDYEVHLNYELVRPTTPVTKKYNDYQISFKFYIRNGNCMAYPFDIVTGNELRDNSITENGFKLDLAKSRYLNLNVKYETVVADSDGRYSTDIRYNRPANEGMEYTEPGIYTFDITNTNTNPVQHTTKTIFVGNDSILFALANSGKTLKELNDLIAQGYKISRGMFQT